MPGVNIPDLDPGYTAARAGRVPGDLEQPLAGKNTSPGSSGGPNSRQMARPSRSR